MDKLFPTEGAIYLFLNKACPSLFSATETEAEYIEVPVDAQGNITECIIYGELSPPSEECRRQVWKALMQFNLRPDALTQIKLSAVKVSFQTISEQRIEGEVSKIGAQFIEITKKDETTIAASYKDTSRFSIGDSCVVYRSPYLTIDPSCIPQEQPDQPEQVRLSPKSIARLSSLQLPKSRLKPPPEFQTVVPKQQPVINREIGPLDEQVDWANIDVEVYPKTIGDRRLPILSLKNLSKYDEPQSARVLSIANRYTHWRKARGDGNSYYRVVAVAYLEHLCRRTTHFNEFSAFYRSIIEQTKLVISDGNAPYIKYFLKKLKELFQDKQRFPTTNQALIALQSLLQDHSFDQGAVMTIRSFASYSFMQYYTHPDLAPFISNSSFDAVIRQIETLGIEAEGVVPLVLACALNAKLVHITLSPESSREYSFKPFQKGQKVPVLHFLIQTGESSVLYPNAVQMIDQYVYSTNSFMNPLVEMDLDENDVWEQI